MKMESEIRRRLADELSKEIYQIRLDYFKTGDKSKLVNGLKSKAQSINDSKLDFVLKKNPNVKNIIIFGAGLRGQNIFKKLKESKFKDFNIIFCDNDSGKWNDKIISPEKLIADYKNDSVVIVGVSVNSEVAISNRLQINKQLLEMNFPKSKILMSPSKLIGWQYFDYFEPNDNEIFADVGALDGITAEDFADWTNDNYNYIYSFEANAGTIKPIENMFKLCKLKGEVVNRGLWDCTTTIKFNVNAQPGESQVTDEGEVSIETVSLDEFLNGKRISLIKMDIEGAEYKALVGARKTISKYKPRLAISIYHKPEDIIELPKLILEMNSEYKLALRHYSLGASETILYAW